MLLMGKSTISMTIFNSFLYVYHIWGLMVIPRTWKSVSSRWFFKTPNGRMRMENWKKQHHPTSIWKMMENVMLEKTKYHLND